MGVSAAGGDTDAWPDLFDVPNLTMEGDDVGPETLALIRQQAADFLRHFGPALDAPRLSLLRALTRAGLPS
jgi:hypothetical protein